MPDPRDPRGVRHTLTSLLLTAVAAVLAGARSFTAVGEWAADAPPQVLAALGVRRDPLTGRFEPPDEATIRRVLETVDAAALDAAVGSWLAGRLRAAGQEHGTARERGGRWPWTARRCGAPVTPAATGRPCTCWRSSTSRPAPCSPRPGVDGKTNEITQFAPLLEPLDLAGCVITADAMHTQREHAEFLVTQKNAHYILVVKKNQPGLYAQVKNLPWRQHPRRSHPARPRARPRGAPHPESRHRRRRARLPARRPGHPPHPPDPAPVRPEKWRTVTIYAITSLTPARPPPPSSPDGSAATGTSKPCTTSATSPTAKTPPRPAPATAPRSWPHCATSP